MQTNLIPALFISLEKKYIFHRFNDFFDKFLCILLLNLSLKLKGCFILFY